MGVIARNLEEHNLVTISLSLVREHTEKIKPLRALFVPFPFGMPVGHPGDRDEHNRVLRKAFEMLHQPSGPVLWDFPDDTMEAGTPLQATEVESTTAYLDLVTEVSLMRRYWQEWFDATGKTSVGLTQIQPARFRGIVRFLEAVVARDSRADMRERPVDVSLGAWIRRCSDDLKALYVEGRISACPDESPEQRQHWLWGETALGVFLRRLRDTLEASDDPSMKAEGFGIAR